MRAILPAVLALAALSGCQKSDSDPGPGGVTVGEARALGEAAEMLDNNRLPEAALEPPVTSESEAPKAD